jgi:carbamoylphosphate synthase large subunit
LEDAIADRAFGRAESIEVAEDRDLFKALITRLGIRQPFE